MFHLLYSGRFLIISYVNLYTCLYYYLSNVIYMVIYVLLWLILVLDFGRPYWDNVIGDFR